MSNQGWSREKRVAVERAFYLFLNQCYIESKDAGRVCLGENLYEGQRKLISQIFDGLEDDVHDFFILKSRQLGISTIVRALTTFFLGVFSGLKGALVFDTREHMAEARNDLVAMLEALPGSFQFPPIKSKGGNNREGLTLATNSKMLFMAAGVSKRKSSKGLGASYGLSLCHASEMCAWENEEGLESFKNSLSDKNPDRLYIWESTARGYTQWFSMWNEARGDTMHCKCIFLGWWSKDSQIIERFDRDWALYGDNIAPSIEETRKIKLVKELYDHDVTVEQLAWVRRKYDPSARQEGDAPPEFTASSSRIQEQPWCVVAGTRVGTDRGLIPIEEAVSAGACSQGKIVAGGPTGTAPIWRVKTKLGYTFRGTGNHPLIDVEGREVLLRESKGSKIRLQPPMLQQADLCYVTWTEPPIESRIEITPDVARFVGLFMGDGSASSKSHAAATEISICCDAQDRDVIAECERLYHTVFAVKATLNPYRGWCSVRTGKRSAFNAIKALGLTRNDTVKTMRKVHVPDFIWRSPKRVIKEFLSGLFEADGFNAYETNRVALFSKYPEFISDVQLLLLAFGITSRSVSMKKKAGDGHFYTGNQLELRTAEALKFNEDIGFISARKRGRYDPIGYERMWREQTTKRGNRKRPQIQFEDEVVLVEQESITEQVWNLTVEGSHLFDANGILTHNTEEEAFQQTGSVFFSAEKLKDQSDKYVNHKFHTYMFSTGIEFSDMRVFKAENSKSMELKVWEEPVQEAVYVFGIDPAYGENEHNDRSAIQVLRCFADGCDQVAEYAFPLINTMQFGWVIAALMGWYSSKPLSEVRYVLELNGPGSAVYNELRSLKAKLESGYPALSEQGVRNVFQNVRTYIYSRPDSMGAGANYHIKTTQPIKVMLMERMRDFISNGQVHIRSDALIKEMSTIARDGDSIQAPGSLKDDRALAMAFAIHCWEEKARRQLVQQRRTRQAEEARRNVTTVDQVRMYNANMMETFFNQKNRARAMERQFALRQAWRRR